MCCLLPETLAVGAEGAESISVKAVVLLFFGGRKAASLRMGRQGRRVAMGCLCTSTSVEGCFRCRSVLCDIKVIYLWVKAEAVPGDIL